MKITKATEIDSKQSTYLIYAKPGMGKTTAIKDGEELEGVEIKQGESLRIR